MTIGSKIISKLIVEKLFLSFGSSHNKLNLVELIISYAFSLEFGPLISNKNSFELVFSEITSLSFFFSV